jgi:hypothetical protein
MIKNITTCRPDLKLYWNLDDNLSIFSKNTFGSTVLETINGNITDYKKNNIGRFAITNTIYDINDNNQNGLFENTSQTTFFLPKGAIQFTTAFQVIKDIQGNFIFPTSETIYKIISGTGIYLDAKGYVVIYAKNMLRQANIYFISCN